MPIRPVMPRHPELARRGPQRGLVTLLFLLILLSAGSYFLLRALNQASLGQATAEHTTQRALSSAREALLGYAVRYPDNPETTDFDAGPGYLPCPDTQADKNPGQADASCAKRSNTTVGLFPWHTLDVPEARDNSGARLWYVVSESHRNHPKQQPLNSDHRGTLGLDQCGAEGDDIVALIIAPGSALKGQTRAESPYPTTRFIDDYLEGQNASPNNDCYSTQHDDTHNDRILAITRQELMAMVEARVLEDIANALSRYQIAHGAFPWLSPFSAPASNRYSAKVGTRNGLLPLRRHETPNTSKAPDPYAIDGNAFAFDAPFTLRWSVPTGGTVTRFGSATPKEDCLRSTSLSCPLPMQGDVLGAAGGEWKAGLCKVQSGHKLSCRAVREAVNPADKTLLRRTYTVVLTNWAYTIDPPTVTLPRRQNFTLVNGTLGDGMEAEIELKDEQVGVSGSASSSVLKLPGGTLVDSFELKGVPFDLEVDDDDKIDLPGHPSPGELPGWLVANEWHHLLYVAFRKADAPGSGVAAACTSTSMDCLTVNWSRSGAAPVPLKVGAVVLGAGAALSAQVRPGTALGDYFEGANAKEDDAFEKADAAASFNDRLRILGVDEDK